MKKTLKKTLGLAFILGLLGTALPVKAHHQEEKNTLTYTVYWKGIPPKHGPAQHISASEVNPEIWKNAFVSTIPISNGFQAKPHPSGNTK